MKFEEITGGVCAPKGFRANGVHCGIRKNKQKKDLALIVADKRCATACVYTTNLVKGAPILVTQKNVADGYAQAVIVNSGNANTCNKDGVKIAEGMCELVEQFAGVKKEDVVVASTGVIGAPLFLDPIRGGMEALVSGLGTGDGFSDSAAEAIMTTDTVKKEVAISFKIGGKVCRMGAIAKGVGMICPNMATMLCFITTDVAILPALISRALKATVKDTVNMLSVDRDTSTNDTLCVMASGLAENKEIVKAGEDYKIFQSALCYVLTRLCRMLARDGEGATKLIVCRAYHAGKVTDARLVAKSVVNSNLVKAMFFGEDANCGRIMCAVGYAGAKIDIQKVDVTIRSKAGKFLACKKGLILPYSEEEAKKILSEEEILVEINLNAGDAEATAYGCDLTYDYVKINGDYRT